MYTEKSPNFTARGKMRSIEASERRSSNAHARLQLDAGYRSINVISAIGTRGYYARLGFKSAGLYQKRSLGK